MFDVLDLFIYFPDNRTIQVIPKEKIVLITIRTSAQSFNTPI